jgi:putative glutamine amidotransferase
VKERPRIGVTGPDRGGFTAWICTRVAVRRAGGKAIRLRPGRFKDGQPLPEMDGLILGGGADVEPALYRDVPPPKPADEPPRDSPLLGRLLTWLLAPLLAILRRLFALSAGGMDRDRDRFEAECLRAALAGGLPVLGICRGAQFLNVRAGGTLHVELSGFYGEAGNLRSLAPRKRVNIASGTRLHAMLGDAALVNSLHRQAVDQLGKDILCAARDNSGVIQAIEHTGSAFVIGVQWHPEYLPAMPDQQKIFRELVNSAQAIGGQSGRPIAGRSRVRRALGRVLAGAAPLALVLAN